MVLSCTSAAIVNVSQAAVHSIDLPNSYTYTWERYITYGKMIRSSVRHFTLTMHADVVFVRLKALPFALSLKESSLP